jgi:hypothetical protein
MSPRTQQVAHSMVAGSPGTNAKAARSTASILLGIQKTGSFITPGSKAASTPSTAGTDEICEIASVPDVTEGKHKALSMAGVAFSPPQTSRASEKSSLSSAASSLGKRKSGQAAAFPVAVDDSSKQYSRKEKSLGLLCGHFLQSFGGAAGTVVHLHEAAQSLGVERRRIYDIVNVLESIELLARKGKNEYIWRGYDHLPEFLCTLYAEGTQQNPHKLLLHDTGAESRKDKSLGVLSRHFVILFCLSPKHLVSLEMAAKSLLGQMDPARHKTKVRRLYDIANILQSLKLIEKVNDPGYKKPVYHWVAHDLDLLFSIHLTHSVEENENYLDSQKEEEEALLLGSSDGNDLVTLSVSAADPAALIAARMAEDVAVVDRVGRKRSRRLSSGLSEGGSGEEVTPLQDITNLPHKMHPRKQALLRTLSEVSEKSLRVPLTMPTTAVASSTAGQSDSSPLAPLSFSFPPQPAQSVQVDSLQPLTPVDGIAPSRTSSTADSGLSPSESDMPQPNPETAPVPPLTSVAASPV